MREIEFRKFLIGNVDITSKEKAVNSRVSKALRVEKDLDVNLDSIVVDDEKMYNLLLQIRGQMNETNGVYQNSVRKYYLFVNGKTFPLVKHYERVRRFSSRGSVDNG